uniref:hypothetical protein n=1 Tax=Flavobacterium sp. TaxID=239 RepID=UPI00404B2D84
MRYLFFGFLFLLVACQEQKVNLAEVDQTLIADVVDYSAIYFFYEESGDDGLHLSVNDHNRIGTTNWIFHVDKKLSLEETIPALIGFQEKRAKAEMHKKEDFKHYFSYMDSVQKSLAFCEFTDVNYAFNTYFSSQYIKENVDYHQHFETININFTSETLVYVNGELIDLSEISAYIQEYLSFLDTENKALLYLNFEQNCSFGFYLQQFIAIQSLLSENILLAPTHFVYDQTLLENCNCK